MTWLYLPNFLFTVGQVEDCLPQNTCLDGEQSATLSGISMLSKSSKQGSETDTLTMPQSGMTPLRSTGVPGVDVWISSLRASRASLSAVQERDLQNLTQEMDGLPSSASFAKYDPDMHCWRTFQGSFLNHTTDEYSATWPKRVSILNKIASRRKKSVRRTFAKDFGLLPTPLSGRSTWQNSHGKQSFTLNGMALHNKWPTPTVNDSKNNGGPSQHRRTERGFSPTLNTVVNGRLNPDWVEWLMGWPIGWTDLEPLAMDRFQLWLKKHGIDLQEGNDVG